MLTATSRCRPPRTCFFSSTSCLFSVFPHLQHLPTTPTPVPRLSRSRHGGARGREPSSSGARGPSWHRVEPDERQLHRHRPMLLGRVIESVDAKFNQIEVELRQTRVYENLDMEITRFWAIFNAYKAEVQTALNTRTNPYSFGLPSTTAELVDNIIKGGYNDALQLQNILKIGLYNRVMEMGFSEEQMQRQTTITDCRYPMEWFPQARKAQRVLHLHVGPTNSGKTYNALKRLQEAKSGCYAGPLRLLAQEVYARMNAKGKPTWLVTGDDVQGPSIPSDHLQPGERCVSCTVEMVDYHEEYDVAVIDEIQMAADEHRGHAWTAALMGVAAKEVHLCGEERTVPIVQEIARSLGEQLVIHRYERLSPLAVMNSSVGSLSNLQKGDCVVCFSIMRIHAMKRQVEQITGKRCAMIYGSLPSEVRAQQARLFNDPNSEYEYLVASDAVGMGLNLAIGRVIFDTVRKRIGGKVLLLTTPEIRQIGGRAGRFKTAHEAIADDAKATPDSPNSLPVDDETATSVYPAAPVKSPAPKLGLVTCFEYGDLKILKEAMQVDPEPIKKIGIFPTTDMIEMFYTYFPMGIPYSFILARILDRSRVSHRFFFCTINDIIQIADSIQSIPRLTITDRIKITFAPVSFRTPGLPELLREMAEAIANQAGGGILDLKTLSFDVMNEDIQPNREYLHRLENLHKCLILYNWMSFRFPGVFTQRPLSFKAKEAVEQNIDKCLSMWKHSDVDKTRLRRQADEEKMDKVYLGQVDAAVGDAEEGLAGIVPRVSNDTEEKEHWIPEDDDNQYPELEEDLDALKREMKASGTSHLPPHIAGAAEPRSTTVASTP